MALLRRRLVVPTVLAVSLIGSTAAFLGCDSGSGDDEAPTGDDMPTTIASDGGIEPDGTDNGDATNIDAAPMPDSPPDARPDAPVG